MIIIEDYQSYLNINLVHATLKVITKIIKNIIMMRIIQSIYFTLFILLSSYCYANMTWYVAPQGNDIDEGTLEAPFATIQHAINVAGEGDIVLVQSGIYTEQIKFTDKNITVASHYLTTGKIEYVQQTIIHGNDKGSVVTFANSNQKETTLFSGFTITHGNAENGGGIYVTNNAQPRLENLIITQNQATNGGGIAIIRGKPVLSHLMITDNSAADGGGIYVGENNKITIDNSIISNNQVRHYGGGIYSQKQLSLQLSQNTITYNKAELGGGIYSINTRGTFTLDNIQRNDIYDNHAKQGNDLYLVQNTNLSTTTLHFNIFSVQKPTNYHIYPNSFIFDIRTALHTQLDSDLYVSPDGNDKNEGTINKPLKTITTAITKLLPTTPHTIYLQAGTYSASQNGEIYPLVLPNYVSLQGDTEENTILDAEQQAAIFYLKDVQETGVADVTIKNGYAQQGAGLYIENSTVTLQNLTITNNTVDEVGLGSGIFSLDNESVTIKNVSLIHNQAGSAIYQTNGIMTIENSLIVDNTGEISGGIYSQAGELTLMNVTLADNVTTALACVDCSANIQNSIIWGDTVSPIWLSHSEYASSLIIDYSTVQQGQVGITTDSTNLISWLDHNMDIDPQFVNPATDNYQLQATSSLINAGNSENAPQIDRLGNKRYLPIDIGAYEYQPQPTCYYNVTTDKSDYTATNDTGSFTVTTFDYCDWTVDLADNTWLTLVGEKQHRGTATVEYHIVANPTAYQRTLQFSIADKILIINQAGLQCSYSLQPTSIEHSAQATTATIQVTAPEGCAWSAGSNDAWISLLNGNNGNGTGTTTYYITENATPYTRQGTLKIADQFITLKQSSPSSCDYQLEPTSYQTNASGGIASITLTAANNCQWTAGSNDNWLSIVEGNIGTGNGTIRYFIANNPNESNRLGTLKIADQLFTVTQTDLECTYQIDNIVKYYDAKTNQDSLNITAPKDCRWNIMTDATWIKLISANTGLGSNIIHYTVQPNDSNEKRTATIAIEDQTLKITQLGKGPSYLLNVIPTQGGNVTSTGTEAVVFCNEKEQYNCSVLFENEAIVTLVAQNNPNWTFSHWDNDCQSMVNNLCVLNMNADKTVTAYFEPLQTYTSLYLEVSSPTILHKGQLQLTGKLNRFPDRGEDLSDLSIQLTITAPDDSVVTLQTDTHTDTGQYLFDETTLPVFAQEGTYTFQTHFAETEALYSSDSLPQSVLVGKSAGYAILIQGKIANEEGLAAHQKTLARVRKKLLARGFETAHIYDFGYSEEQLSPNETTLANTLTNLQKKVNGSPAPIYFIMVDHGGKEGEFYIDYGNNEKITPELLDNWLTSFEVGLTNKAFIDSPRVVIIGACYSGSFIPDLSGRGRIIVTSAAADEVSYKGLLEPDDVRSGEFFIDALFYFLGKGKSLKNAFELATQQTEIYTRQGGNTLNNNVLYQDEAVQHPLLDDNGDRQGSNILKYVISDDTHFSDGFGNAQNLYLGVGNGTDTNATNLPADILSVTETLYLTHTETKANLSITVNNAKRVNSAPIDIRLPTTILENDETVEQTEQLEIQSNVREFLSCSQMTQTCQITTDDIFKESGKYEIFYFVRDNNTQDISAIHRSVVYKNRQNNHAPKSFKLLSPIKQAETQTVLIFDWEKTTDPDSDPVTYNLVIGQCDNDQFNTLVYRQEELHYSMAAITATTLIKEGDTQREGLRDQTQYCWQVEAVDAFGSITKSPIAWFKTNNPNAAPSIASINVNDILAINPVKEVNITHNNSNITTLSEENQVFITAQQGIEALQFQVSSPGYQTKSVDIAITTSDLTEHTVTLVPLATFSTQTGEAYLPVVNISNNEYYTVTLKQEQPNLFRLTDYQLIYQSIPNEATFSIETGHLFIPSITVDNSATYQVLLQQLSDKPDVFRLVDHSNSDNN